MRGSSKAHGALRLAALALLGCLALLVGAPCADLAGPTVSFETVIPNPVYSAPTTCATCVHAIEWKATDNVSAPESLTINLYLSLDAGATWKAIAVNLSNPEAPTNGAFSWYPPNLPTTGASAIVRVEVVDEAGNAGYKDSNGFQILRALGLSRRHHAARLLHAGQPARPPHGHVRSRCSGPSLRRADGRRSDCSNCHNNDNIQKSWRGTMMGNASIDPLFRACLEIATADAPESGDLCLRCHLPRAWLNGRSTPTDGSAVELDASTASIDKQGVSCDLCHRMVDPGSITAADVAILNDLDKGVGGGPSHKPIEGGQPVYGNGMYVLDRDLDSAGGPFQKVSYDARRGPFASVASHDHTMTYDPFYQSSALCGTCHDVSNPQLDVKNVDGSWSASNDDDKAPSFKPSALMPIERTYSEWLASDFAVGGMTSVPFGIPGVNDAANTCQDCHLRDLGAPGAKACSNGLVRADLPIHEMAGGNVWVPQVLKDASFGLDAAIHPDLDRASTNARYMLRHAATVTLTELFAPSRIEVKIQNESGHKLPTGYPEGRRMWINVKFFDDKDNLLRESNAYNNPSGHLDTSDSESKIYEAELVDPDGDHFHFVKANQVAKDNRIPPRGYKKAQLAAAQGGPVPASLYADGQSYDATTYTVPDCTARAEVRVLYQTASREYIEFLRDENPLPGGGAGQVLYDLWKAFDRSPPVNVGWTSETGGVPDPHVVTFDPLTGADPQVCAVVSRKTHAARGPFDVDVFSGDSEPRRTGTEKRLTLIAYFDQQVKGGVDLGTASVEAGTATLESRTLSADQREVTFQWKDVADEQCLSLKLSGFSALDGTPAGDRSFRFPVLLGDVSTTHEDPSPTVSGDHGARRRRRKGLERRAHGDRQFPAGREPVGRCHRGGCVPGNQPGREGGGLQPVMRNVRRWIALAALLGVAYAPAAARGAVILDLRDSDGDPNAVVVDPGSSFSVDVALQVTGGEQVIGSASGSRSRPMRGRRGTGSCSPRVRFRPSLRSTIRSPRTPCSPPHPATTSTR